MATQLFALDRQGKTLTPLARKPMADWGFSEPYDLETWLASCPVLGSKLPEKQEHPQLTLGMLPVDAARGT